MRRVVVVVLALLAASCSAKTAGHPSAAPPRPTPHDTALAGHLETAPPGSKPWNWWWGSTTFPTIEQFVRAAVSTDNPAAHADEMRALGLVDVVHRTWNAPDADEIDIILLRYTDPPSAESRFLYLRDVFDFACRRALDVAPRGFPKDQVVSCVAPDRTPGQFVVVRTVAYLGDVTMEAFYYSPGRLLRADLDAWISKQLTLLR